MDKTYILGLNQEDLEDLADKMNWPSFRGQQIYKWIYAKEADNFDAMTNISKEVRSQLSEKYSLRQLKLVEKEYSPESETVKFLWELHDGRRVESVWIPDGKRTTICISSQVSFFLPGLRSK